MTPAVHTLSLPVKPSIEDVGERSSVIAHFYHLHTSFSVGSGLSVKGVENGQRTHLALDNW